MVCFGNNGRYFGRSDDGVFRQLLRGPVSGATAYRRASAAAVDFGRAFLNSSGVILDVDQASTSLSGSVVRCESVSGRRSSIRSLSATVYDMGALRYG